MDCQLHGFWLTVELSKNVQCCFQQCTILGFRNITHTAVQREMQETIQIIMKENLFYPLTQVLWTSRPNKLVHAIVIYFLHPNFRLKIKLHVHVPLTWNAKAIWNVPWYTTNAQYKLQNRAVLLSEGRVEGVHQILFFTKNWHQIRPNWLLSI